MEINNFDDLIEDRAVIMWNGLLFSLAIRDWPD